MTDPVTPISLIDKISLFMGVHEQSAVVVMDLGKTIILNIKILSYLLSDRLKVNILKFNCSITFNFDLFSSFFIIRRIVLANQ